MLSPYQRQKTRGDQGSLRETGMGETGGSGSGMRCLIPPHWLSQGKPSALWGGIQVFLCKVRGMVSEGRVQ